MLQGHYNYYGVTGNFPSIAAIYRHTVKRQLALPVATTNKVAD